MFKNMRGRDNKIEIPILMRNLTGQDFETCDYRNKIFKEIFQELKNDKKKEEKLRKLLEDLDGEHSGFLGPHDLKYALSKSLT
jgi:hypothetical protein